MTSPALFPSSTLVESSSQTLCSKFSDPLIPPTHQPASLSMKTPASSLQHRLTPCWILAAAACAALLAIPQTARAADQTKANNTTNLDQTGSWTLGVVPGSGDVGVWDDTVTAANTTVLGSNLSWQGIRIGGTTRTGAISINAGNVLTLGTSGIDMSSAPRDLNLNSGITVGGNQTWNVGTGRTLYLKSSTGNLLSGSANITKNGTGTLRTETGASAANDFSGTLTIEQGAWITSGSVAVFADASTANIVLKNGVEVRNAGSAVSTVTNGSGNATTNIDGNVTFVGTTGGITDNTRLGFYRAGTSAAVNIRANAEINVSNAAVGPNLTGGRVVFAGVSESGGSFSLTKTGQGLLYLENASAQTTTYTGGTFVNEGTLVVNSYGKLPTGGNVTVNGGTLRLDTYNNLTVGTLTLTNGAITQGTLSPTKTLTASSFVMSNGSVSQILAGTGAALTKGTAGTVTLSAINTYTGATTVNVGTLLVSGAGSINSTSGVTVTGATAALRYDSSTGLTRNVTLASGGTLQYNSITDYATGTFTWTNGMLAGTNWNGTNLGGLTVGAGKTISPGNSPGTAATTSQTWDASGSYLWEINDATQALTPGSNPGWDLLSGTGTLTISATSLSKFTINVTSLNGANPGNAANYTAGNSYKWLLADFANPISGFDTGNFTINTSAFSNQPGAEFQIKLGSDTGIGGDNTQLWLVVPEPATWALLAFSLTTVLVLRRRRN